MKEHRFLREDRRTRRQMHGVIILFPFCMLLVSQALSGALEYLFLRLGVIGEGRGSFFTSALLVGGVSIIVGTGLSTVFGRFVLRPFDQLLLGMSQLRVGKYDCRLIERKGIYHRAYQTFNALASELSHVEILRSDFINNFSHEFKTPIASMQGLIGLMKTKRLPEEKQKEYLLIIEEELNRLSMLTTNVLHLTKLESQSILTDISRFNLSEQLRTCVLLLEKSWSDKSLSISIDIDEAFVAASEDLLKQVWLNLLDNAIKHSPEGGSIGVEVLSGEDEISVRILNEGAEIPEEERERIFKKFYQSESVGQKKGNGIGLSIVSRIVSLHRGRVFTKREGEKTVFEVVLPIR